jgi:D-psicose/D-tagatose/L-ribulose 3-epimerase
VHIGENHRGYLGSGHLDFDRFFDALAENVSPTLSNDLAIWRNLWSDGRDLAKHAREFIADQLERAAQQR